MDQDADARAAVSYAREFGETSTHCEAGLVNQKTNDANRLTSLIARVETFHTIMANYVIVSAVNESRDP